MKPDTTPTPRTASEWSWTSNGLRLHELCKQLEIELAEKTNAVARLRELLEAAYGLCEGYDWNNGTHAKTHGYKRKVLEAVHALKPVADIEGKRDSFGGAALATSPEESANPTCANTTHKFKARTRHPLPTTNCKQISSKLVVPLEDELKDIDQYADKQNDFYTCRVFQSIEYSLHYLRDEVKKLKEAR